MFDVIAPRSVDQIVCLHVYDGDFRVRILPLTYDSPYLSNQLLIVILIGHLIPKSSVIVVVIAESIVKTLDIFNENLFLPFCCGF